MSRAISNLAKLTRNVDFGNSIGEINVLSNALRKLSTVSNRFDADGFTVATRTIIRDIAELGNTAKELDFGDTPQKLNTLGNAFTKFAGLGDTSVDINSMAKSMNRLAPTIRDLELGDAPSQLNQLGNAFRNLANNASGVPEHLGDIAYVLVTLSDVSGGLNLGDAPGQLNQLGNAMNRLANYGGDAAANIPDISFCFN